MKKSLIILPVILALSLASCGKSPETMETNKQPVPVIQTGGMENTTGKVSEIETVTGVTLETGIVNEDTESGTVAKDKPLSITGKEEEGYEWKKVSKGWFVDAFYIDENSPIGELGDINGIDRGNIIILTRDSSLKKCEFGIKNQWLKWFHSCASEQDKKELEKFWNSWTTNKTLLPESYKYIGVIPETGIFVREIKKDRYLIFWAGPQKDTNIYISFLVKKDNILIVYNSYWLNGSTMGISFSLEENPLLLMNLGSEFESWKFSNSKINQWYQDSLYQIDHLDETIKKLDLKPR